jgi:DUF1365 family protein
MSRVDHIAGHTFHGRKGAVENAFRYAVDYVLLDAEAEVSAPFFRRNRAGLTSLHDSDHGGPPKQGRGAIWVREVLARHAPGVTGRVLLMAQPRVLGHVFNPISFWLCHDSARRLIVVIAEVTNTYGDRHSYICHNDDFTPIRAEYSLTAQKILHVSPFQPVEGGYEFRFDIRPDRIHIRIDYRAGNGGLFATLTGPRRPLTAGAVARATLRLGSRRVLLLIHWQALKLWWKGAPFRSRPQPPTEEVSR